MFALFITLLRPNTSRMLNISEAACNWLEAVLEGLALVAHKQKSLESNKASGEAAGEAAGACCQLRGALLGSSCELSRP